MTPERDILDQLKAVRKIKGYSYQTISDKTEEIGRAVSLSTVKRVFAADSKLDSFRYDTTIQPIATVVLGIGEATEAPDNTVPAQEAEYYATIEALKTVVRIKNETIDSMQKSLEEKAAEIDRIRDEHEKSLEYTRSAYQKGIADRNRTNRNLCIALFALLAIVLGIIILDLSLGGYGWFRRAASELMTIL